jgi:diguanylate cyclase (GGDEF)-like protein
VTTKEGIIKFSTWVTLSLGALFCFYSLVYFPVEKVDVQLIGILLITVFLGQYLHLQLPRTKIHLSISDAMIFVTLILYGIEIAVLLAIFEATVTSLSIKLKGGFLRPVTMGLNAASASIATFATAVTVTYFFVSMKATAENKEFYLFVLMLGLMAFVQFLVNSIFVAIFTAKKTEKSIWRVWNETCLNVLVVYVFNAIIAGVIFKAFLKIDAFMALVGMVVLGVVFLTYRRYVDDVKETSAKAEQAERARAEQAEKHIEELKHHISEQDRIGKALRESKERFRHAAFHDALTNLPNRNLFLETIRFMLEKSKTVGGHTFAVLFLDLNRFKTINESLGHSIGDKLILHVGKRLSNLIREGDLVARFSGDEFAVILNNVKSVEDAVSFAEIISQKLSEPFNLKGRQVFTGVSIGIAMSSPTYADAEDILRDADIAMYYAKDNSKVFEIFDKTMHARAVTLLQLETDLRYAIDRHELCTYFQPIIDLDSLNLVGFEALIRWNHPRRGLVPPVEFIPVSEETGLIVPITLWILRDACQQMVEWQSQSVLNKSLVISVNLSGKHFAHGDLVEQVQKIIEETGIKPECLKLEITESAVMENAEMVILMLKQLKKIGVQLSIDDFGTGYSSLSYLHRFPIDTLKVDRSFVSTMENGSENGEIVRTIVSLAKTLGMNVIAEGIETIHQIHQLRILGCEYGQGYLFSRPVPSQEAEQLIQNKDRWQHIISPAAAHIPPVQKREVPHLRLAK